MTPLLEQCRSPGKMNRNRICVELVTLSLAAWKTHRFIVIFPMCSESDKEGCLSGNCALLVTCPERFGEKRYQPSRAVL